MGEPRQELISNGVLAIQGGLYQFMQNDTFSALARPPLSYWAAAPIGVWSGMRRTGAR